ncbi:MAG: LytTR family DNA-binding domain-containing protein [Ruminococcus sp.]|nr:LytTR family DNA-binding domain-containing protein [Ruminococcus sp.]
MWKIAICDDEKIVCDKIKSYLDEISQKLDETFIIDIFYSAEQMLSELSSDTDIILLDIKMNKLTGIEAAKKIREKNERVYIIFITIMTEYALEGYEVHAFGFIKKPVCYAPLERYMTESIRRLSTRRNDLITINNKSGAVTIYSSQIIFIEAYRHNIVLVTTKDKISISTPLAELEKLLASKGFFRTHKSYLVNMRHIKSIENSLLVMSDGSSALLSKHRKKKFMESFIGFSGGMI